MDDKSVGKNNGKHETVSLIFFTLCALHGFKFTEFNIILLHIEDNLILTYNQMRRTCWMSSS